MQDVCSIPNAEFHNLRFKSAKSVSTDSRRVSAGEIFFALRGEKFDGHDFVADVMGRRAACAIVDRRWYRERGEDAEKFPLVVVDDTTRALGDLARIYRGKFSMPVIAVGGSNGKTTTKEMAAKVLGKKFRVVRTSGNHNNQIGVPLTILGFKKYHEAAVVEIGTNHFGEIRQLCGILEPDAGLITNVGAEHLEFFKNLNGVKKEESELFDFLRESDGIAFVNADDKNITGIPRLPRRRFNYGFQSGAPVRRELSGRFFGVDKKGCALFEMKCKGKTELIRLRVPGIHNAANALAAAAIGYYYGLSPLEIKKALENYKAYEKRMQLIEVGGVKILNDTYNSNPESAFVAIHWLSIVQTNGKRIAVLADMLELGESAEREHEKVGRQIAKANLDYLFTFGNLAEEIAVAADNASDRMAGGKLKTASFDDKEKLSEKLLQTASSGDVVLIKGSRGMKMEEVVNALTSELSKIPFPGQNEGAR
jgi:UDP-N-acetylmuramoyl-tripeptide--D-alanyl-D-alanine ligase